MKAKEIMTAPVVTVTEGTPVSEVAAVLHGGRISAVPVLDAAGAVVGLVSEYDLLARPGATAAEVMTATVISVTEDTDDDDADACGVASGDGACGVRAGRVEHRDQAEEAQVTLGVVAFGR